MALAPMGPNAEQIRYWNEQGGPRWLAWQETLDAQLSPLGLAGIERARPGRGERVIDVGCGCGQTSLQLGERVGPLGSVLGVDISAPLLGRARERAGAAKLEHVRFEEGDAQAHHFRPESADLVFSRFGVMFFADPPAAFANLLRALRPGGRLTFVCWQELARNPWMAVAVRAVASVVPLPPPAAPDAPGPFAFADPARVSRILERAGFGEIALEPVETAVSFAGTLEDTTDFMLNLGPASRLLAEAGPEVTARARAAVRDALAPHTGASGTRLPAAIWIATARHT
jgi:SAM-dependent methyltransferase